MKTAVEWLEEKLKANPFRIENDKLWNEAKEMEKNRIIEAHFNGCETGEMFNNENRAFITDSEQYFNETFK